jgi:hypothetical protein
VEGRQAAGQSIQLARRSTAWSRGTEGALSGRISCVRNVETPSWSVGGGRAADGRPIVRGAEYQAGKDGREAKAGGRKATGNHGQHSVLLQGGGVDNRPDTGRSTGPERELTRAR